MDELLVTVDHQYFAPEQILDSAINAAAGRIRWNNILVQGGFKRTDLNDTESDSTALVASRHWISPAAGVPLTCAEFSPLYPGEITNTTMLFYPGVMISARVLVGLMPPGATLHHYRLSNTAWGSDVDFSVSRRRTSGSAL